MATLVKCPKGHRWEIKANGSDPPPQVICPTCGAAPEGQVDEGTFTSLGGDNTPQLLPMASDTVLPRQRQLWERGDRVRVETLLELFPDLRENREAVLDLINHEIVLRTEFEGAAPALTEYRQRFSDYQADLEILFEVHQAIEGQGEPTTGFNAPLQSPSTLLPQLPFFTVEAILGEGGMGVVYKAMDQRLKRTVALKMIRAGGGLEDRVRFRTEAVAVAQLQHAHITQIHEIGEHEGRPFLSLEYVEGGTLAMKLARSLPTPREAAQMVEVLARTMHFAHQRGIIHRDLKPSNVLLTKDGQPKISDFGLAKRTLQEGESARGAMTQTGVVLGTPHYMAPEQAGGLIRQIGPATDIYALGVILYEMLTGKPPFEGSTAMQALVRVMEEEPVAPTKVQPRVPRDLETICLTCLEKKPSRRYVSAEALADDLRAFLAGDPIQARPATATERMGRWARRRPTTAVLLVVATVAFLGLLVGIWLQSAVAFGGVAVLSMLLAAWWYNARLQAAVRELAHEHRAAEHNVERLHFLLESTRQLMAAPDVDAMLAILGATAARLVAAERSTIYMLDPGSAELWSRIAMGDGVGEIRVPVGTGISGMVGLTGETIILDDPYNDERFNPEVDKRTGYRTRNLLTMPVKSAKGTIVGVFQMLNKRQGSFGREDVELLTTLAASAAVALENARFSGQSPINP